jgi:hypothetical protein
MQTEYRNPPLTITENAAGFRETASSSMAGSTMSNAAAISSTTTPQ